MNALAFSSIMAAMVMRAAAALLMFCGCTSAARPLPAVVVAAPPKDDGKSARGGSGGEEHAAALEQLKSAQVAFATDRQNSVRIPLPDGATWMRVKFWGIPTLVGFRYGQGHHAVVGGTITHVPDENAPGACSKSFEQWAAPMLDAYDIEIQRDAPQALAWHRKRSDSETRMVDVESLYAKGATLMEREEYAVAYGTYPAWKGACLVLGVAVPARDGDVARAKAVRDRFVNDVLPAIEILADTEPPQRY